MVVDEALTAHQPRIMLHLPRELGLLLWKSSHALYRAAFRSASEAPPAVIVVLPSVTDPELAIRLSDDGALDWARTGAAKSAVNVPATKA